MIRRNELLAYASSGIAIAAFAVLLVFALIRLFGTEEQIREGEGDNMLWTVARAESATLRLHAEIARISSGEKTENHIRQRFDVLLSRMSLLEDGPQLRYMTELGVADGLREQHEALRRMAPEIHKLENRDATAPPELHTLLTAMARDLGRAANRAMVRHWEDTGKRLDRQRRAIFEVIISILAILGLGTLLVVTLLRAMAEQQRTRISLARAREASELYRSFAALVSHQLRTPLAIIDSAMQRILRSGEAMPHEEIARRARQTRSEVAHLTDLISATMDIIRLDSGQVATNPEACDIAALLERTRARQLAETPDREITTRIAGDVPTKLITDPVLAEQILANLLGNALRYSPAEEPVTIRVSTGDGRIHFSVRDRGPGIPPEEQERLFIPFYRASTAGEVPGTGIGLAVSRQMARLLGGEISLSSSPDRGSEFTLSLPTGAAGGIAES